MAAGGAAILAAVLFFCLTVFCADLTDGRYMIEVALSGGSGRASVASPCGVSVSNGKVTAEIVWSSPHYDYMIVGDETYLPVNTEGNSVFEIPVADLDEALPVRADTTAMGTPHEIAYTLSFDSSTLEKADEEKAEAGADGADASGTAGQETESGSTGAEKPAPAENPDSGADWEQLLADAEALVPVVSVEENAAADCFRICSCAGGGTLILTDDGGKYLILPEGGEVPEETGDMIVLGAPVERIYLAASAAMCQFADIGAVDRIAFSGLQQEDWYIEDAVSAMEEGSLVYAGKYSSPDYELLLSGDCSLAVESTMILHTPKVREKLTEIGIPVMIDRSSYEADPLGRTEWIRVYGALTGKKEEAEAVFEDQRTLAYETGAAEPTGKTAAFFYLNSHHQVVTRSPEDYMARMIEMAGLTYIGPEKTGSRSAVTMTMEDFYLLAADADYLIYNATIAGAVDSLEALGNADPVLGDFRAVREGNVYCTTQSVYQKSNAAGSMIRELRAMTEGPVQGAFLRKLE